VKVQPLKREEVTIPPLLLDTRVLCLEHLGTGSGR
jgi:hypothetical protein